jgi:L-amino acid N-acyltransferase YncA
MPVSTTITVVGVKDTINALRKIDPQLQKDFKAQATQIAEPAIKCGKAVYTQVPLSGMNYKWQSKGRSRKNFPFTVAKANAKVCALNLTPGAKR